MSALEADMAKVRWVAGETVESSFWTMLERHNEVVNKEIEQEQAEKQQRSEKRRVAKAKNSHIRQLRPRSGQRAELS